MTMRLAASFGLCFATLSAAHAATRPAYVVGSADLRTGPSALFAVVDTIAAGTEVELSGCVVRFDWCRVNADGREGWISALDLEIERHGRRIRMSERSAQADVPIAEPELFEVQPPEDPGNG